MTRSLLLAFALPLALTLSLAAPAHASDAEGTHPAQSRADVVDIAIGSPDHTTLVAALQAADLVATTGHGHAPEREDRLAAMRFL